LFMPNVSHLFPDLFVTDVPPFLARSSIPPVEGHRA
jgi:hypothetical protein